ncbi:serine/threonine protein kinase [Haliangium ochraceum DSM 14365]|uniref:Serine/threonine protein kinase n=2 Tax=Haliangium ochraceum TaxID=80816 RepID=D0LID3_HALO1|nr:serine/threonine protein kinase [Haliangium ochraceum DSM 14365]
MPSAEIAVISRPSPSYMDSTNPSTPLSVVAGDPVVLEEGVRVGEYEIEDSIGEGGFGTVFKAVHPLIGKVVAIKVLHRRYSAQPEMVSRFVAEARAVNQIRHRNIIDIFAFGQLDDGRHYYVMEYLEGMTLEQYLGDSGRVGLVETISVLRALARALDAAHAKGIAHRDLKPDNVFMVFDEDGTCQPKLLDFGIAKLLLEDAPQKHKTRTGAPIGTPQYMSPEQCRGRDVDHRTDIYGFGIIAYRMLTGVVPFDGEDYMDILLAQLQNLAVPPSQLAGPLPPDVDEAVLWMLEKDPEARPPSLAAAVRRLEAAAAAAGLTVPRGASLSVVPAMQRRASAATALIQGTPQPGSYPPPSNPSYPGSVRPSDSLSSLARASMRYSAASYPPPATGQGFGPGPGFAGSAPYGIPPHAAAPVTLQTAPSQPRVAAMRALVIVLGLAGAVLMGVVVNSMLAEPAPANPRADESAVAAAGIDTGEGEGEGPERPGEHSDERILVAAGEGDEPGVGEGQEPGGEGQVLRLVTLSVAGTPPETEVYGPTGLLGVVPGKVQLPVGEEPVVLTFKASKYRSESREVVPSEDRALEVELAPIPRGRSNRRPKQRGNKVRKQRDTIENPFDR